jgi:hypothetical protein
MWFDSANDDPDGIGWYEQAFELAFQVEGSLVSVPPADLDLEPEPISESSTVLLFLSALTLLSAARASVQMRRRARAGRGDLSPASGWGHPPRRVVHGRGALGNASDVEGFRFEDGNADDVEIVYYHRGLQQ